MIIKVVRYFYYLLILLYIFSAGKPKEGLLVIPGLGSKERLSIVVNNLKLLLNKLNGTAPTWDCIVYVYAPRNEPISSSSFWSQKSMYNFLSSLCEIVENPFKLVTENLFMVQPALLKYGYQYIFILLDDCELMGTPYFDLDKILYLMESNSLTVASPFVQLQFVVGGGQQFRNILQTERQPGTEGYSSVYVEIFAWVMTVPAYEALWRLLCPSINPFGWGYDFW